MMQTDPSKDTPANLPPRAALPERKPWPMWPIAISIVLFIAVYTYINLEFRKDGGGYEPYKVFLDQQNKPVDKNLYDWYLLRAEPDGMAAGSAYEAPVAINPDERELELRMPEELVYFLPSRPVLLPFSVRVESVEGFVAGQPLQLRVWLNDALAADKRFHLLSFYKEGKLFLLPSLYVDALEDAQDILDGDPQPHAFTIPTDPIEPGVVTANLLCEGFVAEWRLTVAPDPFAPAAP